MSDAARPGGHPPEITEHRIIPEGTRPVGATSVAVRGLAVEVLEGPDASVAATSHQQRLSIGSAETNDLRLADPTVSRFHCELRATSSGIVVRDLGSTNGTWAGAVRIVEGVLAPGAVLTVGRTRVRVGSDRDRSVPVSLSTELAGLVGRSIAMRRLMSQIEQLGPSETSVLVVGESGTGKEVVARSLHALSARASKPLLMLDCAAVAPALVTSEIFGHEKGAFTGAERTREGVLERAHGGTVLLDELGELPLTAQAPLLGALERKYFRRVGGAKDVAFDARVIAATHSDLRADVNEGRFRANLYFRLAVVTLEIPPLRARLDDLPILVEHFCRSLGAPERAAELLTEDTLETLRRHRWPGNVRELRNWVEARLATDASIAMRSLSQPPPAPSAPTRSEAIDLIDSVIEADWKSARARVLGELERRYLSHLMARAEGNVAQASRIAKLDRTHLTDMLRRVLRH